MVENNCGLEYNEDIEHRMMLIIECLKCTNINCSVQNLAVHTEVIRNEAVRFRNVILEE